MICKWCGATIDVTKGKCPDCGRNIPALSDCGGFYGVVPKATRPVSPHHKQETCSNSKDDVNPLSPPPKSRQERKKHAVLPIAALALLLAFGIFMIVQSASLGKTMNTLTHQVESALSSIGQMKRSNDPVNEQIAETKEQLGTEPTVQEYPEPTLSKTDVSFCVIHSGTSNYISDNLQDQGDLKYQIYSTAQIAASYDLNKEELWKAKLSEAADEISFGEYNSVCFSYGVDDERLGEYQSAEFLWLYRSADTADWIELEDDGGEVLIKTDPSLSESTLMLSDSWLQETSHDGILEVKCILIRHSKDGGTLKIDFGAIEIHG